MRSEFGDYSKTSEGREEAEVLDAQAQPLQDLRTAAGVSAKVRALPVVFPAVGPAGRDSGSFEVVVVRNTGVGGSWFSVRKL
jgi:hypothetical protein